MNLSFASFNAPYNPVRFIYEKIASFDTVPYGPKNNDNYNQTSFIWTTFFHQIMLVAKYPKNRNQACSHGGIRGWSPQNLFKFLQTLFCQKIFLLKNIIKTKVLAP